MASATCQVIFRAAPARCNLGGRRGGMERLAGFFNLFIILWLHKGYFRRAKTWFRLQRSENWRIRVRARWLTTRRWMAAVGFAIATHTNLARCGRRLYARAALS